MNKTHAWKQMRHTRRVQRKSALRAQHPTHGTYRGSRRDYGDIWGIRSDSGHNGHQTPIQTRQAPVGIIKQTIQSVRNLFTRQQRRV